MWISRIQDWFGRGLACVLLFSAAPGGADERILDFRSDIRVQADGSLEVIESIRVRAQGLNIQRGIYRDFPTRYRDRLGNRYRVDFEVLEIERNGDREAYHTENLANGIRVYMGRSDVFVTPGEHQYRLRYRTTRQLGFFDDYDELYWNVTGNGWMFPIDHASARIELPAPVPWEELRTSLYTGYEGAAGTAGVSRIASARVIEFETTAGLLPRQGLTVAVGWPKGIVAAPTTGQKISYFFKDNGAAVVLLLGLLAPLTWYIRSWRAHGRDPAKGVIIPRFKPPEGLSAAGCRYVMDMGLGKDAFSAAVVSLGVKGYLMIDEQGRDFVLRRLRGPASTTATRGEAAVLQALLPSRGSEIELDNENYREFQRARSELKTALAAEHKGRLFRLNSRFMVPALIMSALAAGIAATQQGGPVPWIAFAVLSIALHLTFLFLLRAPTPLGRRMMDEIEGFRMYLDTAEQDRLERMRSPKLTPEAFEMFLPFAYALGVENSWCDRFAREFPLGQQEDGAYRPHWYRGTNRGLDTLDHLGSKLGSDLSGAISSAATPPGSSSGSGGGGSSGGGGGGGGGGGW